MIQPHPIGLCLCPEPPPNAARTCSGVGYAREILRHAGLFFSQVNLESVASALPHLRALVCVGSGKLPDDAIAALQTWVASGGVLIAVASDLGCGSLLGVEVERPAYSRFGEGATLGEGYLSADGFDSEFLTEFLEGLSDGSLHFFGGVPIRSAGARVLAGIRDVHGSFTERVGVSIHAVGAGAAILIAPDLVGAVVRIQQGIAITRDGVPPSDGSAALCDGVLKSDDGGVLDWILDRSDVPGVPGLCAFLRPVADLWKDLLLRTIFYAASRTDTAFLALWYYPRNLPAVGHLSHDTDGNQEGPARDLLRVLQEAEVKSTWCVILPGYSSPLIQEIRAAGHELAMHFDTMTNMRDWNEPEFGRQFRALKALFGDEAPTTNKNHYLRWEGDTEFFNWCEACGIELDQSKGASKTGVAGFNFGTCHPYFPASPDGAIPDVLELPTPTQDLEIFAPRELLPPLLEGVIRTGGVLHLLFHPAHIQKPGVAEAIRQAVETGRTAGLEWWTAAQLNRWERARRQVTAERDELAGGFRLQFQIPEDLAEATLFIPGNPVRVDLNKQSVETVRVNRWGAGGVAVILPMNLSGAVEMEVFFER